MLTPPYHFAVVASPLALASPQHEILYRGAIPAQRNLPSVRRLGLRTLVYLRKQPLGAGDGFVRWAERWNVDLRWVKAEEMGEQSLGMGKTEVIEVLKIVLDPSTYPLYIADLDGISHTTLVVAVLRKLQGYHPDSILDEIARFQPEHEDLPLLPFLNSFGSTSSSSSSSSSSSDPPLSLPPTPYPAWLWPNPPGPPTNLTRTATRERAATNPGLPQGGNAVLPFPHPLAARRHPTMRLAFPPLPPLASTSSSSTPPLVPDALSRTPSRRDRSLLLPPPALPPPPITDGTTSPSLVSQAASLLGTILGSPPASATQPQRMVSFSQAGTSAERNQGPGQSIAGSTSPEKISRPVSSGSEAEEEEEDGDMPEYDDDDDDEYDEDEEDEDEDEDPIERASEYISALDLAGFG